MNALMMLQSGNNVFIQFVSVPT